VICDGSGSHLRVAGKTLNSRSKLVQIAEDLNLPFSAIKDRKRELTDEVSNKNKTKQQQKQNKQQQQPKIHKIIASLNAYFIPLLFINSQMLDIIIIFCWSSSASISFFTFELILFSEIIIMANTFKLGRDVS
jgi:hypothetical protein